MNGDYQRQREGMAPSGKEGKMSEKQKAPRKV
jgi:hypothetical protein